MAQKEHTQQDIRTPQQRAQHCVSRQKRRIVDEADNDQGQVQTLRQIETVLVSSTDGDCTVAPA